MAVTEIPSAFEYRCDACGRVHTSARRCVGERPPGWATLEMIGPGHHDQQQKRYLLLCVSCGPRFAADVDALRSYIQSGGAKPLPILALPREPATGQTWRHYKGHEYVVVGLARDEPTVDLVVVYRRRDEIDPPWWVRRLDDFLGNVETSADFGRRRFERVS